MPAPDQVQDDGSDIQNILNLLDSGFRRNDVKTWKLTLYEFVKCERVKMKPHPAFKPNNPLLQHSYTLPVAIPQIATDITINTSLGSLPVQSYLNPAPWTPELLTPTMALVIKPKK